MAVSFSKFKELLPGYFSPIELPFHIGVIYNCNYCHIIIVNISPILIIFCIFFYSTTIAEVEESFSQFSYNDMGGSVLTNPSLNSKNSIPLQTE